jgi:hypothetical protein
MVDAWRWRLRRFGARGRHSAVQKENKVALVSCYMEQRPRSITIVSWLFIIFGSVALLSGLLPLGEVTFAQRLSELKGHWMVHLVRILGIVSGVFMLRGRNWARWLLVVWIAIHIVISALHSALLLLMHVSIFAVVLYFVFRPRSSSYFKTRYF